ncbi:MAG TPA: hypothetical protein PJ990_10800, partial [Saprospiraceae bacterium]|nr:hypothetical protein [Saprospiraceae bacterium]
GDVVVFRIEVFNQGTFSADNIQVVDYIPTCFTLFDSDWVSTNGNRAIKTLSVANGGLSAPLASGQSVTVDINLKVLSCTAGDYFNWSEIGAATDDGGNIWPDVDSTPDNVRTNDVYTQDNFIDGNGKQGGDEDDHDPALVTVVAVPPGDFDLALIKQLAPGQPSSVQNGDLITFLISVVNQGDISDDNINVVDYYPPCFVLTDPSWINNGNNTASHLLTVENTRLDAPLLPGSVVQVPISFTLNNCPIGTSTNYSEVQSATDSNGDPVTDVDSSPDNNNTNDPYGDDDQLDGNGTDDEDDHDPETIQIVEDRDEVFDLALIKTLAPGQQNTVMAGDPAKFQIQITNQGNVPADNIVITDYIPNCFELNDSDCTVIGGGRASLTLRVAHGGLLLPLASGLSVFAEITLNTLVCNVSQQINFAEVSGATDSNGGIVNDIDSSPDSINGNDAGGNPDSASDNVNSGDGTGTPGDSNPSTDEDDHDPAVINITQEPLVYDLALIKTLTLNQANPVNVGDNISFDIQVTNQGEETVTDIEVTDYIPNCLTLNDANWSSAGSGKAKRIIAGPLAANQSTIITINLTVESCATGTLTNWSEISSFKDASGNDVEDIDSTPDDIQENDTYITNNNVSGNGKSGGDEDDHDPEQITINNTTPCTDPVLTAGEVECLGTTWSFAFLRSIG